MNETKPIYLHNCPALGPDTQLPRAIRLDKNNEYVLFYQHKCPFCSATAGEIEYGAGVTPLDTGGYAVDIKKAEKVT